MKRRANVDRNDKSTDLSIPEFAVLLIRISPY